eukprot:TRINITY_DN15801_c0_g1_i1.p1 TRINITY_DN15801_c0_g1~~TRINITY_DN15801_c0_g1_i1.p1  ORF type:complete len:406 (-),score=89.07 TRINITY_DN15801_c0_g1_i1:14-1231(-)
MANQLTADQKKDLNEAIADYLRSAGYNDSADALEREAELENVKKTGVLAKKWTVVPRLQKKILELEAKNKQLTEEAGNRPTRNRGKGENLPVVPEIHTLTGHRDGITCVKFHPVFNLIITSSSDATIKIWDFDSGELEKTLKSHTLGVQCVDFDHTGNILASCSQDLSIKLWDFQTYECQRTLKGHDHTVSCVRFLPSGDQIISSSRDKTIKIWETQTGYCLKTLQAGEWIRSIQITEDGQCLASAANDGSVRFWDLTKPEVTFREMKEHDKPIETICFSPGTVQTLETIEGKSYKGKAGSGNFLATGCRDNSIKIWEVATGLSVTTLVGHDNWVRGLIWHPNGKYLISVSDDKSIKIWDIKQARAMKTISGAHDQFVSCLDYNVRNPTLATGGVDDVAKIWSCT